MFEIPKDFYMSDFLKDCFKDMFAHSSYLTDSEKEQLTDYIETGILPEEKGSPTFLQILKSLKLQYGGRYKEND